METSKFLAAIEELYGSLRILHPDLPEVQVMYLMDNDNYGMAWTEPGARVLAVTTAATEEGPRMVFDTVLHEAVHLLARVRGINDIHGDSFHNQQFATLAYVAFGLKTYWFGPEHGWSFTKSKRKTRKLLKGEYKNLRKAMR